jgi:hypothetical protein
MHTNSLLLELLISGFFAVACLRARAGNSSGVAMSPRNLLRLTDRLERLRQTRWQWCAMVVILVVARLQSGAPLVVELTAAIQFAIFLALPVQLQSRPAMSMAARKPGLSAVPRQARSVKAR